MRKPAFIILFFLGSLNAASLSSLHIDRAQSHAVQCEPNAPGPNCHASLPHQHDAAHAGEESLFEYIFNESREAALIGLPCCLAYVYLWFEGDLAPARFFAILLHPSVGPPALSVPVLPAQSRAPPVSSQA